LEREVVFLRSELARQHDFDKLVGQHPEMQKLYHLIAQVARTTTTVLITGESGTGKELVARAIHRQGPRRDRPFVPVSPAALSDSLVESELFGHERGAFTGAFQRKVGRFEMAHGGTLFLDEISLIRPEPQAKLLRVLQEREFERVGGTRSIRVDARIIAATNVDLKQAVADGRFREDLYYRLHVVPISVPPLRERREDVPLLAQHFIRQYSQQFNRRIEGLSPEAMSVLQEYRWPGNVRELLNVIERLVALAEGPVIGLADLPLDLLVPDQRVRPPVSGFSLAEASEDFERQIVVRMLERVRWNVSEAARLLGIHRNSLKMKLARWGLRRPKGST
jgi:two-component system response regulator AtoC